MKRHLYFAGILVFIVLMLPQVAFADIPPHRPYPITTNDDDDDDCSASPLTQKTQNWPILLILMVSMGVISMGAIYRINKSEQSTDK